jgi:hypothetical protein
MYSNYGGCHGRRKHVNSSGITREEDVGIGQENNVH